MKSTGIVRKVDELGRIVLPIELRRTLDIAEKDLWKSMWKRIQLFSVNIRLPVFSAIMRRTLSTLKAKTYAQTA